VGILIVSEPYTDLAIGGADITAGADPDNHNAFTIFQAKRIMPIVNRVLHIAIQVFVLPQHQRRVRLGKPAVTGIIPPVTHEIQTLARVHHTQAALESQGIGQAARRAQRLAERQILIAIADLPGGIGDLIHVAGRVAGIKGAHSGAVAALGLGIAPRSPALSFRIKVDADGSIRDIMISPSVVKVTRLSYEKADELLRQGELALVALSGIAEARRRRRIANGAVEISFPETSVRVEGESISFLPVPETRSGEMVREMMLLAGEASGRWAKERSLPFLYSSQEAPSIPQEALSGMELPAPLSVQYIRRKGMRASIVGTESLAHRGLGMSFYSQVTSPLRRYQDLLTHYQIRLSLQSERGIAAGPLPEEELGRRCLVASQAAAQTRQAERDSRMHWTIVYLSRNPCWQGEASVLDIRDREAWILVKEFGLETGLRCRESLSPDETISIKVVMAKIPYLASNFEMI